MTQSLLPEQSKAATPAAKPAAYSAPALDKGIDILELLTEAEHGLAMAEIAQRLGRSLSEIFRMVVTLQRRGWVRVDYADRYHLSSRMFELAHRNRPVRTLTEAAIPAMQAVARKARQSCHLTVIEGGRILVIAQVEAPGNQSFNLRTGAVVGMFHTASGQVLLAFRSAEERERLLEQHALLNGESGISRFDFMAAVDQVAADGYACSPSLQTYGVTNLGYPVWGRHGQVVAALVIPYLEGIGSLRGPTKDAALLILGQGAMEISVSLGHTVDPPP
ncbi:MAG: IclR family transcriptional regulator [Rhodoferax sp.]|nr:IclR family transcriptional regulator [Rhodoferax sp.]